MNRILLLSCLFLMACGNPKQRQQETSTAPADSQPQQNTVAGINPLDTLPQRSTDTVGMYTLPPVFEGDIVLQQRNDEFGKRMEILSGSPFTQAGMIFLRERDGVYVVIDVKDSARITPLREWVDQGVGHHVILMRHQKAEQIFNEKRTKKLRMVCRDFRKAPEDQWFSWDDQAMYSSELIWKAYFNGLKLQIAPTRSLAAHDRSDGTVKKMLAQHYGQNIPLSDACVTPADLLQSPELKKIYEY